MQIIIPMSGFGERFRRAGYEIPKPLIEIDGRPIIAHVIDMFQGEQDFIFICNQDHLNHPDYHMEDILRHYCPTGRIVGIPSHKLGPIYAVQQVEDKIDMNRPVVVNYCDFTCYWDWHHFKKFVKETRCVGAIPAYKGFHPHTLGTTNYAYMREEKGWVLDIQEKQPYTNNRMEEFASSGTYYFSSGKIMCEAFKLAMEQNLNVGGEFYVSLAYKPLLAEKNPIAVYPIQHFMQWGTPEDILEYKEWSSIFNRLVDNKDYKNKPIGSVVIPMAGLGQRFVNEGYTLTKPLIPVSGKPMVLQAVHGLPKAIHYVFVLRGDMPGYEDVCEELNRSYPGAIIETISHVTDGQACTGLIGLDALERSLGNITGPVTFGACDNGVLYNQDRFQALIDDPNVDVIVWGYRGHPHATRHPNMYGWIDVNDGIIRRVSVKTPLSSTSTDPIVIGTFTFKKAKDFQRATQRLIERNGKINGEFYIDSCINDAIDLGLQCVLLEVDHFISWGTPNDLKTFEYWQSCFHKWEGHPYSLDKDYCIPPSKVEGLEKQCQPLVPGFPGGYQ